MNAHRILVVDDNPVVLKALQLVLTSAGYSVFTALDGSETIRMVREAQPHLIVLDISFPPDVEHGGGVAWDGFRIMQWLQRIDESRGIPIVIITGEDPAEYQERALELGATAFFTKPVDNEGLVEVIQQTLAQSGTASPSA